MNKATLASVLAIAQEARTTRGGTGKIIAYARAQYNHASERIREPSGNGVYCYPLRGRSKPPHQGKKSTATGKADIAWEGKVKLQVVPDDDTGFDYMMKKGDPQSPARLYVHQILTRVSILVKRATKRIPGDKVIEVQVFDEAFLVGRSGFLEGEYGRSGDPHLGAWNWDEYCAVSSHEVSSLTLEEKRVAGNATHKPFLCFGRQVTRTALDGVSSVENLSSFVMTRTDNPMHYHSETLTGYKGDYSLDFSIDHCAGTVEVEDPPPPDTRNPPDPPPPDVGEGGTPTPPWYE